MEILMFAKASSPQRIIESIYWKSIFSLSILIVVMLAAVRTSAQHSGNMGTPAESKPGQSAASTYARDKIETVNLANGNLSVSIPLVNIGGRGSASYTIALSYNSKVWSARQDRDEVGAGEALGPGTHNSAMYEKELNDFEAGVAKLGGGWTIRLNPGIKGKVIGVDRVPAAPNCPRDDSNNYDCGFKYALTKMWLTLPDGSQVELRDQLSNGAPAKTTHLIGQYHQLIDRERGRLWRSTDGSNVIFIRDLNDSNVESGEFFFPSGWVFLPDGTRMRMVGGAGTKIIDRNGNFITLGPPYVDQLGRETFVETDGNTITIRVKGYGVPDRLLTINRDLLGANLRANFSSLPRPFTTGDFGGYDALGNRIEHQIQEPHTDLFNESEGKAYGAPGGDDVGERLAVTQLNLPDGRFFRFRYNQYGEVAEIVYPGGGVSQIDYNGSGSGMCGGSSPMEATLNRRVSVRRSLTNGADADATWVYGVIAETIDGVLREGATVDVYEGPATGPLLSSERHFFLKLNAEYRICAAPILTGTGNEKWDSGREFRTEMQTAAGTVVTMREWSQPNLVWGNDEGQSFNDYLLTHGQDQAPNDPHVVYEDTILEDGKMKRVEYDYDQFNNVTRVKEHDFGTVGAPGPVVRQTMRTYATGLNGYCYSNLNGLDSSCGGGLLVSSDQAAIINAVIYQPRLMLTEKITTADEQNVKAFSEFEYDTYTGDSNHHAVIINSNMRSFDGSRFSGFLSDYQPRGNATRVKRWAGDSNYIYSFSQFDNAGNVIWTKDPNNNVSTLSYVDNFGVGTNPDGGVAGINGPTFALPTLVTNALAQQSKIQYDYSLGAATGNRDSNGIITLTEYDSQGRPRRATAALGLSEQTQTETTYPTSTLRESTSSRQLDGNRWLVSKIELDGFDRPITAWQSENSLQPGTGTFTIRTNTIYDALSRVEAVSNPYRPATETPVYTTTDYYLGGLVKSVTAPDGGTVNTYYNGNRLLVKDQAGKERMSETNALGQLSNVWEILSAAEATNDDAKVAISFPGHPEASWGYRTKYDYDTLGNLAKVTQQKGTNGTIQTRDFTYDPLSRLKSASNPESGTTSYQYYANGNLLTKTDARSITTTFVYDSLNRNTTIDYSNTAISPDITHVYDGATRGVGRLSESFAGGNLSVGAVVEHTKIVSYDALGRPLDQRQRFKYNGQWQEYRTQRSYNLAGAVTSQVYPSNHTVSYNYDGAGRLGDNGTQNFAFTGNLGDGVMRTYSRGNTYNALGGLSQEQFGTDTAIYNKLAYNSRGQLAEIKTSTVPNDSSWNRGKFVNWYSLQCGGASCNGPDNNGNLRKQEVSIPLNEQNTNSTSWYQQYEYDSLNRLTEVHEHSSNNALLWRQSFSYDRYGNRTINANATSAGINNKNFEVEPATNRLLATGDSLLTGSNLPQRKMRYDAVGNLTNDSWSSYGSSTPGAVTRTYDAENRMTSAYDSSGGASYYGYNADGQRVRRTISGQPAAVETWQVHGIDGALLAEYAANAAPANPQKEYGYRNGQLLITAEPGAGSLAPAFSDDFNDNSLNTNKWTALYPGGSPTVTEQAQQLQITLAPNTAGYNGVDSVSTHDLTGRMVQVEVPQVVSQAGWTENFFSLELNANNSFLIDLSSQLMFRSRVNGVNDQTLIAYSPTLHRHWRIRHDQSANTINFETSADGSVWTVRKTVTPGFALTGLRFRLAAGAWGTGNGSPGAAKYDNLKLLASTAGGTSVNVANFGFESPAVGAGSFQYAPTGGAWTFAAGGGLTGNNSGFTGGLAAPEGSQAAFLQAGSASYISQSISGFQAGTNYIVTFAAAQRSNCCNAGGQDFQVYLDGALLGTFHPSASGYADYSTPTFTTSAGTHVLKFVGLNSLGGDHTAFIDNVRIQGSPVPGLGVQWLVTDQLGTPRIVFDKTGALATAKRHDYLPFGEELASQGLRGSTPGYAAPDGVRQQFTQKERDVETGLDYFGARYYSAVAGRFSSPDNFLNDTHIAVPQSWNLYSFVHNNPLKYIDPTGEEVDGTDLTEEQRQRLVDDWKNKTGYADVQFVEQENGRTILVINTDAGYQGGSETARTELLEAAQSRDFIFDLQAVDGTDETGAVRFAETGMPKPNWSRGGLVMTVKIDFGDFDELRGDEDALEANSVGFVVMHEIEHNLHGQTRDGKPDPGDVERLYLNPMRRELGLPERQFYAPNHFSNQGEKHNFLFYKAEDHTRKIVHWSESQIEKVRKP
jgi:RHS repeat-associated protein